jgi:CheY-like chemotaxis protein
MPSASSRRILLVEDNQMVREVITLMLEEDYDVVQSTTIAAARQLLLDSSLPPVGVILLDCLLPDGRPTALFPIADRMGIPVVLISGDPGQAEELDAAKPFLTKPFSQDTLLSVLDSARD